MSGLLLEHQVPPNALHSQAIEFSVFLKMQDKIRYSEKKMVKDGLNYLESLKGCKRRGTGHV